MKIKISKDLILFLICIPLFLCCTFYISSRMNNINLPSYSVENKSKMGYNVFFQALKELNVPVYRTLNSVEDHDNSNIQIVVQGGNFNINDVKIKRWVNNGGVLVYLRSENSSLTEYGRNPKIKGKMKVYKYNKGTIITLNASYLTNETLTKDTGKAYELLKEIDDYKHKKIYFNEANLFSADKKSLWDCIPMEIKYIIYQFVIILAAFFYYKGKRFGKVIPLYEEEEREENEYLYSAASLYRQAKCWDIMVESYYKSFLKKVNHSSCEWLKYWESEKLPNLDKAKKVYKFMNVKEAKIKSKEYIQIVNILEQLINDLEKRRDLYWKTLKRPQ
ncbi:DUF4350 domain-containing protein [Clostridium sp. P21]|uniref:DUF4350 domain-containing protein n=1 Tax=Clostridium muellerianum TaxID=2716538 RepID=A0A7Y0HSN9_9CLOT|nr:DUF4350 domain-containing protein [Clostridium muellerianum]NMM66018.1 DUF4350 domain-containing protein [Clostridium muellerianum]